VEIPAGFTPIQHSAAFGKLTGPFYEKPEGEGGFVRALRVAEKLTNSFDIVHGGMMMTFADIVLARACREAASAPVVTLRMVTNFVAPARLGDWLEGRAKVTRATRSLVYVTGRLSIGRKTVLTADGVFRLVRRERDLPPA